jgi:hypothetical protein
MVVDAPRRMVSLEPKNLHIVVIGEFWHWSARNFMLLVEIDHMRRKGATAEWA